MASKTVHQEVAGGAIELVQGDITKEEVDAIVNAANEGLRGGGGVDGAIHRAGGPSIMEECRKIGYCVTGDAVVTGAGRLRAKWVIHTVGPIWRGGTSGEPEKLASCYRRSLEIAKEKGVTTIAFPSISTGVYGYPVEKAAPVALRAVQKFLSTLGESTKMTVRWVLFDEKTYAAYQQALEALNAQEETA